MVNDARNLGSLQKLRRLRDSRRWRCRRQKLTSPKLIEAEQENDKQSNQRNEEQDDTKQGHGDFAEIDQPNDQNRNDCQEYNVTSPGS